MPEKNILKEDATKRLIELLRESDSTVPEQAEDGSEENVGGNADGNETQDEKLQADNTDNVPEMSDVESDEGDSELMGFLHDQESTVDDDLEILPEPQIAKEHESDRSEDSKINYSSAEDKPEPDDSTELQAEILGDKPTPANKLQSLLANLDSTMSSRDDVEILGQGNSRPMEGKPPAPLSDADAKNTADVPTVIDSRMAVSDDSEKPRAKDKTAPKRSLKYIRKFDYDTLYDAEKPRDEEYMHNWNTGEFFKSVLYLKDTAYGLDFGDDFIRFVEVKKRQDKIEISNWGITQLLQNDEKKRSNYIRKKTEDVFNTVFNDYLAQLRLKNKFIAHAIQNKNLVSRIFSFPKLTPAEVREAIEINARKNLPFPDKFAQIDHSEIATIQETQKKYHYLVGIAHERTINSIITRFKEAGTAPRKLFSASLAVWSLFKNNYPDMEEQSVILLHIGEKASSIVFINEGLFQFDRELAIGARDFRDALNQKVNTLDGDHFVDSHEAEYLKNAYGFPLDQEGVTEFLHIEVFKLLILLRSEGERLVTEINRSIDFYRKVYSLPPLESDIYLSGPGSKIPNIDLYISRQLNRAVHRIFPLRSATLRYADGLEPIPVEFLPEFDLALASATEIADHTNLIPKNLKFEEKFIPAYMASIILLLLTLLAITVSSFAISSKLRTSRQEVRAMEEQIATIAPMGQKYSSMINYHNTAWGIKNEISQDNYYSDLVPSLMKAVSQTTQEEIKLTQFLMNRERLEKVGATELRAAADQIEDKVFLHLQGFVTTSSAIADVVLENYRIKLSNTGYFSSVAVMSKARESADGMIRLRFTIQAELKD